MQKVPYMAVVGQREAECDSLALRVRGAGKKQEVMTGGRVPGAGRREVRTRAPDAVLSVPRRDNAVASLRL